MYTVNYEFTFPSTKMKLDRNVVDATLVLVDWSCVKTLNGLVAWASKPNSCSKPPSKSTSLSCPLQRKNQLKLVWSPCSSIFVYLCTELGWMAGLWKSWKSPSIPMVGSSNLCTTRVGVTIKVDWAAIKSIIMIKINLFFEGNSRSEYVW